MVLGVHKPFVVAKVLYGRVCYREAYLYTTSDFVYNIKFNIVWDNYGDGFFSLPVIYDQSNGLRIVGKYDNSTRVVKYTLPALAKPGAMFIQDEAKTIDLFSDQVQGVIMLDYSKHINKFNQYLMITSKVLYNGPKEEVKNYEKLWSSRYNVTLNMIEDLYNSFSYGINHPLAVRYYCKYVLEKSTNNKPKYLLP